MKIIISTMAVVCWVLLRTSIPTAFAQSQPNNSTLKTVEYIPGQVWMTDQGIPVTILAIEDVHRVGKVVHVRIDKIPVQSREDIHLTRAIEHLALTEKMMRKSGLVLSKDNVVVPEASIEVYRKWEEQKKHEVVKVPIQKAISTEGSGWGPMICNFLPSET